MDLAGGQRSLGSERHRSTIQLNCYQSPATLNLHAGLGAGPSSNPSSTPSVSPGLQGADRVDLCHVHDGSQSFQSCTAAFPHLPAQKLHYPPQNQEK